MKTVATLVAALGLTTTFAGGAFAAQHEMDLTTTNCAEYLTMDEETQMGVAEMAAADMEGMDAEEVANELMEVCNQDDEDTATISLQDALAPGGE
ncbi:hypothetical protein ATO8_13011 [Roseivivax marinus]|jgi:hypothetical protein|uniref:HdeA/HdeB family protein n=1 Tax=Roseivivax marinus TaxID=1379903 RepID=W4HJ91_9RHOB|nr:hypothetical protein [Roseivivax marinus]ETW12473.1 hypothetical protein ATO8_13011 [Roseivivax marinus]UMA64202.1 hypothetical protein LVO79_14435 [Roseivivax marinus]SEK27547.1 HdeA/HdeB family protein [Roseivivax marinus]